MFQLSFAISILTFIQTILFQQCSLFVFHPWQQRAQHSFAKLIQSFVPQTLHAKVGSNPQQLLEMVIYCLSNNDDDVIVPSNGLLEMMVLAMTSGKL